MCEVNNMEERKLILFKTAVKILKDKSCVNVMCKDCPLPQNDNTHSLCIFNRFKNLEDYVTLVENEIFTKNEEEAVKNLNDMDKEIKDKASKFDKINEVLFMACGMIEDGDTIRYIIHPEIVLNKIIEVICSEDISNREKIIEEVIEKKKAKFYDIKTGKELLKVGDEW